MARDFKSSAYRLVASDLVATHLERGQNHALHHLTGASVPWRHSSALSIVQQPPFGSGGWRTRIAIRTTTIVEFVRVPQIRLKVLKSLQTDVDELLFDFDPYETAAHVQRCDARC